MVPYRKELSFLALVLFAGSICLVCRYQRVTEEAVEMFLIGVLFIWYRTRLEDEALKCVVPVRSQSSQSDEPPQVQLAVFEPIEPRLVVDEGPLPAWLAELEAEPKQK